MRKQKPGGAPPQQGRAGLRLLLSILATVILAATLAGGVASAGVESEECFGAGATLASAKDDYAANCTEPRVDCDKLDATWYCSDHVIGEAAPNGNTGPASTIVVTPEPDPEPDPVDPPDPDDAPPAEPIPVPTPEPAPDPDPVSYTHLTLPTTSRV